MRNDRNDPLKTTSTSDFASLHIGDRRDDIGTETHVGTLPPKINRQRLSEPVANLFCHQSTLLWVGWYRPLPLTQSCRCCTPLYPAPVVLTL